MIGAGDARIMRTHLFPHVVPALAVWATLAVATNIMLEAGITFALFFLAIYTRLVRVRMLDMIVLWMDPRAARAGTRRSAVGRVV